MRFSAVPFADHAVTTGTGWLVWDARKGPVTQTMRKEEAIKQAEEMNNNKGEP